MSRRRQADPEQQIKALGILALIVATPLTLIWLYHKATNNRRRLLWERSPCSHGVSGGSTMRKCEKCLAEEKVKELAREQARTEEKRMRELCLKTETYRRTEIIRLRKGRLREIQRLEKSNPFKFEEFVADLFRAKGYQVEVTPPVNDAGKDAIAYKGEKKFLIECKRYDEDNSVGRPLLQKFFAAIYDENAEKGFFVTTSYFSSGAVAYAKDHKIELIDRDQLTTLINEAFPSASLDNLYVLMCSKCGEKVTFPLLEELQEKLCPNGHKIIGDVLISKVDENEYPKPKLCPKCNQPLQKKEGRYGNFWGCSGYPKCKFTMDNRKK